jgi:hypothetical protein
LRMIADAAQIQPLQHDSGGAFLVVMTDHAVLSKQRRCRRGARLRLGAPLGGKSYQGARGENTTSAVPQ